MSPVKYATKEDIKKLERKIDTILKEITTIKEDLDYLSDEEINEIEEISEKIKEGKEEVISLEEFRKRYENEI